MWAPLVLAALLAVPVTSSGAGYAPNPERSLTAQQERRLVQSLFDLRRGRLDDAVRNASHLVRQQPDFDLAQLIYGDLLKAQTEPLPAFGYRFRRDLIDGHLEEARARLRRYLSAPPPVGVPEALLRLSPGVSAAIVIDLESYRLFLFESQDGRFVRTSDFYVSIGKGGSAKRREGDEKTPVGVYVVDEYLPGSRLPDMYGPGAFPINYPNGWDRAQGRTGSGIWIHGTESANYSRPPLSSLGCVTLSNEDFKSLEKRVEVGRTPVIVSDGIRWVEPQRIDAERRDLTAAVEAWRRDWESRDAERYLAHYSKDFRSGTMSRAVFADHKRRVNASKRFIEVELDQIGAFRYPGERDLILVDFVQTYRSDSFRGVKRKHQYWRREGNAWRIVLEEGRGQSG
jgi:murein L,D-transpeptidase YafK